MSAELQGGIELPGYARVDSNEPSRHDGTPAMSNQCQLNFPARLLSLDSRRVSLPFVCVHTLTPSVNDRPETPWIVSRVRSKIPRFCDHSIFISFVEAHRDHTLPCPERVSRYPPVVIDSFEYIEEVSIDFQNYVLVGS